MIRLIITLLVFQMIIAQAKDQANEDKALLEKARQNLKDINLKAIFYYHFKNKKYPDKPGIDGLEMTFRNDFDYLRLRNPRNKASVAGEFDVAVSEKSTDYAFVNTKINPNVKSVVIFEKPFPGMNGKLHVLYSDNNVFLEEVGDAKTCVDVLKKLGYGTSSLLIKNAKLIDEGKTKGSGKIYKKTAK